MTQFDEIDEKGGNWDIYAFHTCVIYICKSDDFSRNSISEILNRDGTN